MATDNPVMEPADIFYPTAETEAPKGQAEEEAVTESEDQDALTEDVEIDGQPEESEVDESEESESQGEPGDDDKEHTYLDLDGEDVDLEDVRAGLQATKDIKSMQADYTRKTQAAAENMTAAEKLMSEAEAMKATLLEQQVELQALVGEDEAINWEELREDDPEEYIALKEKADKRKAAVAKLKSEAVSQPQISDEELVSEQQALFASNPSWLKDGKATAEFESDQTLMNEYFKANGFTHDDVAGMFRARYIETCLKAAKFDQLQGKASKIKSKVKKATLVTKPKQQARQLKAVKSREDIFYGK